MGQGWWGRWEEKVPVLGGKRWNIWGKGTGILGTEGCLELMGFEPASEFVIYPRESEFWSPDTVVNMSQL